MQFSQPLALALIQSEERFLVDLNDAWQWIGYYTKQKAKNKLLNNFDLGTDYIKPNDKEGDFNQTGVNPTKYGSQVGRKKEIILLTIDCFKSLGMMAGTEKGKEIRRYFLECERQVKTVIPAQQKELERLKLELALSQSRERLAGATQMLALINPGLPALAFGKPDAVVEIERPITVITDAYGRSQRYDGFSITQLANQYGFGKGKKANDRCRAWIASLGITDGDWIEEPAAHVTRKLPRRLLGKLDAAFTAGKGDRQKLLGERS